MRVFQILIIGILIFVFTSGVKAQACGYVYTTIYLKDLSGNAIKNAKVEIFDKNFKQRDYLHNYKWFNLSYKEIVKMPLISWNEKKQAYYGVEGMCGGHNNVGIRIKANGYEPFDFVENLRLGWHSFSIKLQTKDSAIKTSITKLATVRGSITDRNDVKIDKVKIYLTDEKLNVIKKETEKSYFILDVPEGIYKIEFVPENGLTPTILENEKLNKGNNYLDIKIINKEEK